MRNNSILAALIPQAHATSPKGESFLLLFFKKEGLFFFEKKNQKTFPMKDLRRHRTSAPRKPRLPQCSSTS